VRIVQPRRRRVTRQELLMQQAASLAGVVMGV